MARTSRNMLRRVPMGRDTRVLLAGTEKMTGVEEAVGSAWEIKRTRQR